MPTDDVQLPGTLKRSPKKAQEIYAETLDSAHETYDSEEAAHRVALSSLKHSFEKVGDHWESKDEKGPSDPQAAKSGREARASDGPDRRRQAGRHQQEGVVRTSQAAEHLGPLEDEHRPAHRGRRKGQEVAVWIGTSGWQYADWRDRLYPRGVPQRGWLEHYAARFRTVELNNSFYRLPSSATFEQWRARTPDDFVLAVKASRYLTHIKRLREPAEPVARLLEAADGLGPKFGPVLVQLPGSLTVDAGLLAAALERFPRSVRVAVEVRSDSWYRAPVRQVLAERGAALCWTDRGSRWLTPRWCTAGWGYVRFHWGGAVPDPCYATDVLARRARDVAARYGPDDDVYVYFNNDPAGCAPRDAAEFARLCAGLGLEPTRVPALDEVRVG